MRQPTKLVSFRLSAEAYKELCALGVRRGMSPGGAAREAVLGMLADASASRARADEIWKDVRGLRADLAAATGAILTVLAPNEEAEMKAASWVRKNLNR